MKRIKMKMIALALVLTMAVAAPVTVPFTGNTAVAQAATVKISKSKLTMEVAASTTLKITGTKSKVTWKTSNKAVATVTSKGVVKAQSVGTAKITATVNKKNYTCTVTVVPGQNPYQVSANMTEVQMAGLSFVVPNRYRVSGGDQQEDGAYKAVFSIPDTKSSLTLLITYTGTQASSNEDVAASLKDINQELLQESYDDTYGAGVTEVSDFNTFAYESKNGTTSYAYSFMLTTATASARTISYNLSVDNYSIELISVDEGYDTYVDAEYLIDSLMYVTQ